MHILITGYFYLPTGMASSARIRNIAYGFKAAGADVSIIALKKNFYEEPEMKIIEEMEQAGITVDYAFDGSESLSLLDKLLIHKRAGDIVKDKTVKLHQQKKIDAVFLYGVAYSLHQPVLKFAKQIGATTLIDIVELRIKMLGIKDYFRDPQTIDIALGSIKTPQQTDIILTISEELYKKHNSKKDKYLLPGIEHWNRKEVTKTNDLNEDKFNLLYIGILSDRDDPAYLIELFKSILSQAPQATLTIVGNYMASKKKDYWVKEMQKKFGDAVYIAGRVTEAEMNRLKSEADGFILTRKNELPEICAFPTRLLEFLKLKKPVFISDVGDIPGYLEHMKEACILNGDLDNDSRNALSIINNKSLANNIGTSGWQKGSEVFNRETHMKNIYTLIKEYASSN